MYRSSSSLTIRWVGRIPGERSEGVAPPQAASRLGTPGSAVPPAPAQQGGSELDRRREEGGSRVPERPAAGQSFGQHKRGGQKKKAAPDSRPLDGAPRAAGYAAGASLSFGCTVRIVAPTSSGVAPLTGLLREAGYAAGASLSFGCTVSLALP